MSRTSDAQIALKDRLGCAILFLERVDPQSLVDLSDDALQELEPDVAFSQLVTRNEEKNEPFTLLHLMAYLSVMRQCLSLDAYRQHRRWIFKQQQQAYVPSLGRFVAQFTVSLTRRLIPLVVRACLFPI